jgi:hypothetical protein
LNGEVAWVQIDSVVKSVAEYYRKLRRVVECSVIPVVVQFEISRDRKDCIRVGSGLSGAMCAGEVRVLIRRNDNVRTSANFHETTPTPRNVNEMEFGCCQTAVRISFYTGLIATASKSGEDFGSFS